MSRTSRTPLRRARGIARGVGGILGMIAGIFYGSFILSSNPGIIGSDPIRNRAVLALVSVGFGSVFALAAPLVSVDVFVWLNEFLETAPASEILGAVFGLVTALAISAFIGILLSGLPYGIGMMISGSLACALAYTGVRTGRRRRQSFTALFQARQGIEESIVGAEPEPQDGAPIVVDTSALIDGRIVDVVKTGFIQGRLIVASFVLEELQMIADSSDPIKRARGRRGLAAVDSLKQSRHVKCEILTVDFPATSDVDARLIKLARLRAAALLTLDYNLNQVAQIEGLRVLNINELVNALKPIATTGDVISVLIVKEGREPNQGVGYLPDGTMVVVEGARNRIDETVNATVASMLQTAQGRMIFAQIPDEPIAPRRPRQQRASESAES